VVERVTPLAKKGFSIAGPSLGKIDSMAAKGLVDLEAKVPAINCEPENVSKTCFKSHHLVIQY
jgi:hypothetical protein